MKRTALTVATLVSSTTLAIAQPTPPPGPMPGPMPSPMPGDPAATTAPADQPPADGAKPEKKEPGRGDFDAGGQVRLPSGPDDMGQYATFNWVAFDMKGKYYLLDTVTVNGEIPLAVKKPDMFGGLDPRTIGGMKVTLDARLPKWNVPLAPKAKDTDVALIVTGAYMREGSMMLSEKDFPLFIGDFKPGVAGGLDMRVKLSSVLDFKLAPKFVYQSGSVEALQAVQIPMSTVIALGDLLKVSADLGVFTGDDASFKPSNGGRIYAGGALDVKLGPIIAHGGLGVASLLTGADSMYPTISDSVYIDLNVKYAK
ncbi:MAG TPA: hypothetical protein VM261_32915 [Kofleriaceae bacterium]|nr:hypothetical protein [Kofleriaceae bacterium]